jgi:integrase
MKLTKDAVSALALPAGKTDHIEWDDALPGFGVRMRGSTKRWIVQYRIGPQQRRESLGDTRKVELEAARKIARQRFAQVELGIDPAAERAQARAQAVATKLTLAVVIDRYLDAKRGTLRPSTFKAAERYFVVHWAPLHNRPLEAIKRADVAARLQELVKAHGRTSAARARDHLSTLFSWSMRDGLCEANPAIATNNPAAGIPPRERVLADAEIAAIWRASQDDDFGRIIRLLLLTGARREEIGALRRTEIDLDTGVLTIPGARTKNHHALELPLPEAALDILRSAPRRSDQACVFGASDRGYCAWSYSTARLNVRIAENEGKPLALWRLHDLRRTMRSGLGRLGVAPHVAELCINHARKGIEAVYDRHKYQREIGAALTLWADHIEAITTGSERRVVPMQRPA